MFEWHITIITQMKKRNSYFKGTPVILPDPLSPHWPIAGFKHLSKGNNKITELRTIL